MTGTTDSGADLTGKHPHRHASNNIESGHPMASQGDTQNEPSQLLPQDKSITQKVPVPVGGALCGLFSPADTLWGSVLACAGLCSDALPPSLLSSVLQLSDSETCIFQAVWFTGCHWAKEGMSPAVSASLSWLSSYHPTPPLLSPGSQVGPGPSAPAYVIGAFIILICHKRQREVTFPRLQATKWWC